MTLVVAVIKLNSGTMFQCPNKTTDAIFANCLSHVGGVDDTKRP